jgi:hypothetical protein
MFYGFTDGEGCVLGEGGGKEEYEGKSGGGEGELHFRRWAKLADMLAKRGRWCASGVDGCL